MSRGTDFDAVRRSYLGGIGLAAGGDKAVTAVPRRMVASDAGEDELSEEEVAHLKAAVAAGGDMGLRAAEVLAKYSPSQERDSHGRFGSGTGEDPYVHPNSGEPMRVGQNVRMEMDGRVGTYRIADVHDPRGGVIVGKPASVGGTKSGTNTIAQPERILGRVHTVEQGSPVHMEAIGRGDGYNTKPYVYPGDQVKVTDDQGRKVGGVINVKGLEADLTKVGDSAGAAQDSHSSSNGQFVSSGSSTPAKASGNSSTASTAAAASSAAATAAASSAAAHNAAASAHAAAAGAKGVGAKAAADRKAAAAARKAANAAKAADRKARAAAKKANKKKKGTTHAKGKKGKAPTTPKKKSPNVELTK